MKNLNNFLIENKILAAPMSEQKKALRIQLLQLRAEMHKYADPKNWGPRQYHRALELLKIRDIAHLKNKYLIACYFPINAELDFIPFAQSHWLFPRIAKNKELLWFEYGDGETNYTVNKHGIKEKEEKYCFSYRSDLLPLLCFVPGIAAAQDGTRLGYGGGYYDKFLREFKDKVTSVLCLPSKDFLFNTLPCEEHDEKVDLIVF